VPKFEPDAETGQISADFERGRFAKVSHCCLNWCKITALTTSVYIHLRVQKAGFDHVSAHWKF